MTHAAHSDGSLKELDFRTSDGLEVALLALDAFQHPYAYAAFRGYSRRLPDAQAVADAVVELEQQTLSYL
jgi:hypothetical protein